MRVLTCCFKGGPELVGGHASVAVCIERQEQHLQNTWQMFNRALRRTPHCDIFRVFPLDFLK